MKQVSDAFVLGGGWMLRTKAVWAILDLSTKMVYCLRLKLSNKRRSYEYSSLELGEIRLLKIKNRIPYMGLRTILLHVKLADKPTYEAISYTWGTSTDTMEVIIDGYAFTTSIAIYNALCGRSSMWRKRLVWIDAICINQMDPV
jgi:hypothetical protein